MVVRQELGKSGFDVNSVSLGEVQLNKMPSPDELGSFSERISKLGFEVIEDKTARIISKIKNTVLEFIREKGQERKYKFSAYLSEKLNKDYNYLSHLFSSVEGMTIEQHLIQQKIELVKELLVYDELSLSEIANQVGYSSVQHLSNQFKKITGLTPSHFKLIRENRRKPLDKV
jgi:AraC-like DNA-binding protein